jgi:dTDP-4-amino-4,6-dideoxygalactose transaminase
VAERACRRLVSLPLGSHLAPEQASEAAEAVRAFYWAGMR